MYKLCLLCILGLAFGFGWGLPEPVVTPSPQGQLQRRQAVGSNFIGYTSEDGSWFPESCEPGSAIIESSTFGACAPTTATSFGIATTCLQDSILVVPGTSYPCGINVCYTIILFDNINDQSPHSLFACDSIARTVRLYRTTPASTHSSTAAGGAFSTPSAVNGSPASSSSSSSAAASTFNTLTLPSNTGGSSNSATTPTITSFPSASNSGGGGGSGSNAWIAGAVIGPIAAIVICALCFWIWRLKRRQRQGGAAGAGPAPATYTVTSDAKSELPMNQVSPTHQLSPIQQQHAELQHTQRPSRPPGELA